MSDSTVLVALLGNRDLQIKTKSSLVQEYNLIDEPTEAEKQGLKEGERKKDYRWFGGNPDGSTLVINKINPKTTFRQISEHIRNNYEKFAADLVFPLIGLPLQKVLVDKGQIDKILLMTSDQQGEKEDKQDCIHVSHIIRKHYEMKGYQVEINNFGCPPVEFDKLVDFFIPRFEQIRKQYTNVAIATGGGTPAMRAAAHFAGIFREFEYFSINAREKDPNKKLNQSSFKRQEQMILRSTMDSMLEVYAYEGITRLPGIERPVIQAADKGLHLYNLNTDLDIQGTGYIEKSCKAISLIYFNLYLCYTQGRFADVVGRLHRIEEAVGQHLVCRQLIEDGHADAQGIVPVPDTTKRIPFKKLLSKKREWEKVITRHYATHFQSRGNRHYFTKFPQTPFESGKNFFYYFFNSLDKYPLVYTAFEILNNSYDRSNNKLTRLRNNSILGHGFASVLEDDIRDIVGDFDPFFAQLGHILHTELGVDTNNPFDSINQEITELL